MARWGPIQMSPHKRTYTPTARTRRNCGDNEDDEAGPFAGEALGGVSARAKIIALALARLWSTWWHLLGLRQRPSSVGAWRCCGERSAANIDYAASHGALVLRRRGLRQPDLLHRADRSVRLGPAVGYAEGLLQGCADRQQVMGGTAAVLVVSMTTPMTGMLVRRDLAAGAAHTCGDRRTDLPLPFPAWRGGRAYPRGAKDTTGPQQLAK